MVRSNRVFGKAVGWVLAFWIGMLAWTASLNGGDQKGRMDSDRHFSIISDSTASDRKTIESHLERTWETFNDLFGVSPPRVRVVLTTLPGSPPPGSRADRERAPADTRDESSGGFQGHVIPWTVSEQEDLNSQGFSDLSHEIAHIYFLDLMGNPEGLHQPHAWLHEAVACFHEAPAFQKNRRQWIRDHIEERVPLEKLFRMKNPVKTDPLVALTSQLHEQLSKGEITVQELNRRISAYASQHAQDLAKAGALNMTYYSQSFSLLIFLLEREGKPFIRTMAQTLKAGGTMQEIVGALEGYPQGIESLEEQWVRWVKIK